ncbi:hypothetical protein BO82DRAFT_404199 [Aspergillus uvarum CBS 121591]|uniref:Uncharacterized protein n=1 Tax=Aspergillus uvarum CBS 121591 TaxID=1448315 RepID=A0A319DJE8_9EURO|nr:hypothetical protein BO82DRAFT_404199 [Aspergillus uvarum CBS 121591]PYH79562.1 hypothetical protein BO82DRAFT_404199 [Aspergillus uvarum CBS 121591]
MCAPIIREPFEHEEDIEEDEDIRDSDPINQEAAALRTWRTGTAPPISNRPDQGSEENYRDMDAETRDGQGGRESQPDSNRAGRLEASSLPRDLFSFSSPHSGPNVGIMIRHSSEGEEDDSDEEEDEQEEDEGVEEDEEDEQEYGDADSDPGHHQHRYGEDEYVCITPECPERLLLIQERLGIRRDFFWDAMVTMHNKYVHLLDVSEMGDVARGHIPSEKPWESEDARLEWAGFLNRIPEFVCCDADNNLPCSIDDINDFDALRAWMLELLPWVVDTAGLFNSRLVATLEGKMS